MDKLFLIKKKYGVFWLKNNSGKGGAKNMVINSKQDNNIVIEMLYKINYNEKRLWSDISSTQLLDITKKNNGIYEVICNYPFKVFFDYDRKNKNYDILDIIKNKIYDLFPNSILAISGSITEFKTSFHIIVSNYIIYNENDRNNLKKLVKYLKYNFDSDFDDSVYSNNRNMKCINQSKPDGRIQKILFNDTVENHFITTFLDMHHNYNLPRFDFIDNIPTTNIKINKTHNNDIIDNILTTNTKIDKIYNNDVININIDDKDILLFDLLSLNRINDYNTWIEIGILCFCLYDINVYEIFKKVSQKSDKFNINEFNYKWNNIINTIINKKYNIYTLYKWTKEDNLALFFKHKYTYNLDKYEFINISERYLLDKDILLNNNNILCKNIKMFFNTKNYKIFTLKSPYDTGKTQLIKQILLKYKSKRILWLSYRISLTFDILNKFKDFHFEKYTDNLLADKLIIQVESLLKLRNIYDFELPTYDLIILDEIESLLFQFHSTHTFKYNSRESFDFLVAIIKSSIYHNSKVIALDGDLSERSYHFLNYFDKTLNIVNNIQINDYKLFIDREQLTFENDILSNVSLNKKIVIASMSANYAEHISRLINKNYPLKSIRLYTSLTDGKEKRELINIDDKWSNCDVLIYSPTISAGVSYDKENVFYKLYGIIADDSCTPRDFFQMIHRIRKLENKDILIYNHSNLSLNDYVHLYDYKDILTLNKSYTTYCYDHIQKLHIYNYNLYDDIYAYNEAEIKNKENFFIFVFNKMAIDKGYTIQFNYPPYTKKGRNKKINYTIDDINNAYDISNIQYTNLCDKQFKLDTTKEENIQILKHTLKLKLGLDKLDVDIIKLFYNNTSCINNLCYLIDDQNIVKTKDNNFNEIKFKTIIIRELLILLGFTHAFFDKVITSELFKNNIDSIKLQKINIFSDNSIFKNKNNNNSFKSNLGFINSILKKFALNIKLEQKSKKVNGKIEKYNFYKINIIHNIHELIYYKKFKGFVLIDSNDIFRPPTNLLYDKYVDKIQLQHNTFYSFQSNIDLLNMFDSDSDTDD